MAHNHRRARPSHSRPRVDTRLRIYPDGSLVDQDAGVSLTTRWTRVLHRGIKPAVAAALVAALFAVAISHAAAAIAFVDKSWLEENQIHNNGRPRPVGAGVRGGRPLDRGVTTNRGGRRHQRGRDQRGFANRGDPSNPLDRRVHRSGEVGDGRARPDHDDLLRGGAAAGYLLDQGRPAACGGLR